MTIQLLLLLGLGVLAAVLLLHTVFVAYPRYELSRYRYRLWELRDELWDRAHRGDLQEDETATELLKQVERSIIIAPEVTLTRALLALRASRLMPMSEQRELEQETSAKMAPASPEVEAIRHEARCALVRYISRGSILGWTLLPARRFWERVLPSQAPGGGRDSDIDDQFMMIVSSLGPLRHDNGATPLSSCL